MSESPAPRKPSLPNRILALGATLLTLGLAGGLVAGATALLAAGPDALAPAPRPAIAVPTTTITLADSYRVEMRYRGRIEAGRRVDLGFEAGGTLKDVLVDEGDRVAKGQVLARLDTRALDAERAAAAAALEALRAETELARRTAARQQTLAAREHASVQRLDESELTLARLEAETRRAEAALSGLDIALEKAVLKAPFDATVGARTADEGTRLSPGQPVAVLHEAVAPRLRLGLPADLAAGLAPGDTAEVEIGGARLQAQLLRARTDIDPATRTRDFLFALPGGTDWPEGTLATLTLTRDVAGQGAWVPVTALGEGARGLWTVFVIEHGTARREAVEVVHTAGGQAFVRGHLADGARIVAAGPHRIAAGQAVTPVEG